MDAFIKACKAANLSQSEVAEYLDTKQFGVARLESGALMRATLATLIKYAAAVGCNLKISLVRKHVTRQDANNPSIRRQAKLRNM